MNRVLIDTNIVSYLLKADSRIESYRPLLDGKQLCIAFTTIAELYRWPIVKAWGPEKRQMLFAGLEKYDIFWADDALCSIWAQVASIKGRPVSFQDAWIAAVALREKIPLITHNRRNFEDIPDLQLESVPNA
jgi:tRNA(fMet)-specific endonuclease VapC